MPQKYDEPEPCLNFCHVEGYLNEACKLKKKKVQQWLFIPNLLHQKMDDCS